MYDSFWSKVKQHSRLNSSLPSSIDGVNGAENISNLFADKYNNLYNSVPYDVSKMADIDDQLENLVQSKCKTGQCPISHVVTVDEVICCVNLLKSNKSDGNEGLLSNHIINGSTLLYDNIAMLCTAMIYHGYASPNLRLSTVIPIVKNKKKSLNDSGNYRGIALSSILSKLLDIIIIQKHNVQLRSSEFQFGFKEKSSTVNCTFVADEIINYYCNNDSYVYATYLDASKAFDRVRFDRLFQLLIERNVCPSIARLLSFLYTNQQCRIRWCGNISHNININNGVKQGGVLSPILFNVYLDVLLLRLEQSGHGCHVGNMYAGCLGYADDVLLLSPTRQTLTNMLQVCEDYSVDFNIEFNASKSKLIVFGKNPIRANVSFQGEVISQVDSEKHVGNIMSNCSDIIAQRVSQACNSLTAQFNLLMRNFGFCSPNILYRLFHTYCMSLYGCQLWDSQRSL